MTSVEERMKILKMIEEGKISAEEGAKLLAALRDGGRRGPGVRPRRDRPECLARAGCASA